jgi:predicted PurR-regulated permease PerM
MAASQGTVDRRVVHLSGRAALGIVATVIVLVVLRGMFVAAHRPLSWAVACTVAAVLLDPIVDRLSTHIRRVPAVLLTFLAIAAIGVGTAYLVFDGVSGAIDRLETAAPDAAARIEHRDDRVGEVARDFHLTKRVDSFVDNLGERVTNGGDVLRSTAGTAPSYLVCAVLTLFLMTYGPRMASAALEQDPDEDRRRRIAEVVGPAVTQARAAILFNSAFAFVFGILTAGLAGLLDLPAAAAVGLTAGGLCLLPHVGIILGWVPLLLLSLGFKSSNVTIALVVAMLVLQAVDSAVVRRWIARRSVEIGLLVPFVVALLGYEVYGIGGGAYALAFAVLGQAIFDQLEAANDERIAARAAAPRPAEAPPAAVEARRAAKAAKAARAKTPAARTAAAKRTPADKATGKRAGAQKAPARKAPTKKAAGRRS